MFEIVIYKLNILLMFVYCQERKKKTFYKVDILTIQKRFRNQVLKIHWEHLHNGLKTYFC